MSRTQSQNNRKRLFRRTNCKGLDLPNTTQEAYQKVIDEANDVLLRLAEFENGSAKSVGSYGDIEDTTVDLVTSLHRLDQAAYLLHRVTRRNAIRAVNMPAQDPQAERTDRMDELVKDGVEAQHKKDDENTGTDDGDDGDDDDDEKLWDEFVAERIALHVQIESMREKKPKGRLARFVGRLFGRIKSETKK